VEKFEEMNLYIGAKKRKRPKAFPALQERKWETEKIEFPKKSRI